MGAFNPQKIKNRLSNAMPAADVVPLNEAAEAVIAEEKADTRIIKVHLNDLVDFHNHPFSRGTDEKMEELAESIKQSGLISPPIVRPAKEIDGKYEILAGHRRRDACETIGLEEIEVVFRNVDDDAAALIMVSSNLEQREKILPVEKGYAYKMMLEALNRQGKRTDLTSPHYAAKSGRSDDEIAQKYNTSGDTVRRYIRLTELIKPLQERSNANHIGFVPAVDLSYLSPGEQEIVESTIVSEGLSISGPMAKKLKDLSRDGRLSKDGIVNEEMILYVMTERTESTSKDIKLKQSVFRDLLPEGLKERPLTADQSAVILEEAMALFREKYERETEILAETASEDELEDDELAM